MDLVSDMLGSVALPSPYRYCRSWATRFLHAQPLNAVHHRMTLKLDVLLPVVTNTVVMRFPPSHPLHSLDFSLTIPCLLPHASDD